MISEFLHCEHELDTFADKHLQLFRFPYPWTTLKHNNTLIGYDSDNLAVFIKTHSSF